MVMVNGLLPVVVGAGTLQPGSEKKWYGAACLRVWLEVLAQTLSFGQLREQDRVGPDTVPSFALRYKAYIYILF